jgi:hypothetical protein
MRFRASLGLLLSGLTPPVTPAWRSSCTSPHSADKRRSTGTGAKEAGSNGWRGGQTIRPLCAQSGSCTPLAIGGWVVLKLSRPRAVSSTPSRRRCSPGGLERLMRETFSSTALALSNRSTSHATSLGYSAYFRPIRPAWPCASARRVMARPARCNGSGGHAACFSHLCPSRSNN